MPFDPADPDFMQRYSRHVDSLFNELKVSHENPDTKQRLDLIPRNKVQEFCERTMGFINNEMAEYGYVPGGVKFGATGASSADFDPSEWRTTVDERLLKSPMRETRGQDLAITLLHEGGEHKRQYSSIAKHLVHEFPNAPDGDIQKMLTRASGISLPGLELPGDTFPMPVIAAARANQATVSQKELDEGKVFYDVKYAKFKEKYGLEPQLLPPQDVTQLDGQARVNSNLRTARTTLNAVEADILKFNEDPPTSLPPRPSDVQFMGSYAAMENIAKVRGTANIDFLGAYQIHLAERKASAEIYHTAAFNEYKNSPMEAPAHVVQAKISAVMKRPDSVNLSIESPKRWTQKALDQHMRKGWGDMMPRTELLRQTASSLRPAPPPPPPRAQAQPKPSQSQPPYSRPLPPRPVQDSTRHPQQPNQR
ncbi:hypothetical protein ABH930_007116 [Kitasatospora sp. GAS204A]|nr:hypothetical protein [Kitasatospora sp. GAS204B]MDH6122847.1 hypothetical protein [Kitasatospora sp. GAS204B]